MQPPMGKMAGPQYTPYGNRGPGGNPPLARAPTRENANGPDAGRKDGPGGPVASAGRHDLPCDRAMGAGYAAALSCLLLRTSSDASLLTLP